jgi:hypothetical protein
VLGVGVGVTLGIVGPDRATRRPTPSPKAAVALAYRYPAACLTVTFSAADPAYARVALDRASPCWRYGVYAITVFHRAAGSWREVVDRTSYSCPLRRLPMVVQHQLGVCPK